MRLTRKKAITLCIVLWTWLAKTGEKKEDWPGWEKYENIDDECFFCEYVHQQDKSCEVCPYCVEFSYRCFNNKSFYSKWDEAETPRTRKKYAGLFLEQIRTLEKQ